MVVYRDVLLSQAKGVSVGLLAGEITSEDPVALLVLILRNIQVVQRERPVLWWIAQPVMLFRWTTSRIARARHREAWVAQHYDAFEAEVSAFLGPSRLYSCYAWDSASQTPEDAEQAAVMEVLRAADVSSGSRLLDVGCGWGALTIEALRFGATVDALTLSRQQAATVQNAIEPWGDRGRVWQGHYAQYRPDRRLADAVTAVEMLESLDPTELPAFFRWAAHWLRPGGRLVVQFSGVALASYGRRRRSAAFVVNDIFPGTSFPSLSNVVSLAARAGLEVLTVEEMRGRYVRTLHYWRTQLAREGRADVSGDQQRLEQYLDEALAFYESGYGFCWRVAFIRLPLAGVRNSSQDGDLFSQ